LVKVGVRIGNEDGPARASFAGLLRYEWSWKGTKPFLSGSGKPQDLMSAGFACRDL